MSLGFVSCMCKTKILRLKCDFQPLKTGFPDQIMLKLPGRGLLYPTNGPKAGTGTPPKKIGRFSLQLLLMWTGRSGYPPETNDSLWTSVVTFRGCCGHSVVDC